MTETQVSQKKILLVEDLASLAQMGLKKLKRLGYSATHVETGEKAIEYCRENFSEIDLILMDIDLGHGIDGTVAAEEILKHFEIPILFLSSHTEKDVIEKTEKITSYGYILKDSEISVLSASIKMAFRLFEATKKLKEHERNLSIANLKLTLALEDLQKANSELQKLSNAVEHSPETVMITDTSGIIEYVNPRFYELTGYSKEEVVGHHSKIQSSGLTSKETYKKLWDTILSGKDWRGEVCNRKKNGELYWESTSISPNFDNEGRITHFVAVKKDITELKTMYSANAESLKFFENMDKINHIVQKSQNVSELNQSVLEEMLSILDCDRAWLLFPCDPNAEKWHVPIERTKKEYPGAFLMNQELDMTEDVKFTMERLIQEQRPLTFGKGLDYPLSAELAETFLIQTQMIQAIYPKIGKPWVIGVHQCSHHRIWSDEDKKIFNQIALTLTEGLSSLLFSKQLQENEEKLRLVLTSSEDMIFTMDKEEKYTGVYGKWLKKYGLTQNYFIGKKISEVYDRDLKIHEDAIAEALSGKDMVYEWTTEGNYFQTSLSPIFDESSEVVGIVGIGRNISLRKKAEEKVNLLLEEKEVLLKEVHHRIKNNMNVIVGLLTIQLDSFKNPEGISAIQDAIGRVHSMGILYDKLFSTTSYIDTLVSDYFSRLIHEIILIFPTTKKVEIIQEIDEFSLDERKIFPLGIIINELLTNSMKYAFDGIANPTINFSLKKNDSKVYMSLKDNGRGLRKIVDSSDSSGFGMSLIQIMTKQLGGRLRIESNPGYACFIDFDIFS